MERLKEIENCVLKTGVVADIGCDHGKLAGMLLRSGKAERVIAADISEPSLGKAVVECSGAEFEGRAIFRLGDGLAVLAPGEADTIVIAGMGGLLIADILKKGAAAAKRAALVLCPHSHEAALRKFLLKNGYAIKTESLAFEEGRYYQILCAGFDGKIRKEADGFYYEIGRGLLQSGSPLLKGFLESRLEKTKKIEKSAASSDKPKAAEQARRLRSFAERLEEHLK